MPEYTVSNAGENRFWLQILGDYARLLIHAIPPEDANELRQTRTYIQTFDSLLDRARQDSTPEELAQLNKDAYKATQEIRGFFLQLLNMQIRGSYPIMIAPAIICEAIAFTEEYLYLLNAFINNKQPAERSVFELEIFWLIKLWKIAVVISGSLALNQTGLKQKADAFAKEFTDYLLYSIVGQEMSKIGTTDFPVATNHHAKLMRLLWDFDHYLMELITLSKQNRIPGTLTTLFLDRSRRILCYFMRQLAARTGQEEPNCNPASPRISNV